jgi:hypothetical protein
MAGELSVDALQDQLQAYVNCLELCRALYKPVKKPYARQALAVLIEDLQDAMLSLSGLVRQHGAAPGALEVDRQGQAAMRDALGTRSLAKQLLAVRHSLADLAAWYAQHLTAVEDDPAAREALSSLSEAARGMVAEWDRQVGQGLDR